MTTIDRRPARADPRAPPRRGGVRRARRRARVLRGVRHGRADGPAAADLVDHPLAPLEGADPLSGPPFRVVTFDGRGNGRSDRPGDVAAYAESEFAADALAVLDATGDRARRRRRAVGRRPVGRAARGRAPGARRGRGRSSRPPRRSRQHTGAGDHAVRRAARVLRGLGQVQPPPLAATTTASSSSSSSPGVHRAALDQADRGRVGWGLETDGARRWR